MKNAIHLLVAAVVCLCSSGCRAQRVERLDLTADQWREDLRYLARELPQKHKNAFHFTTKQRFDDAIASLDRDIPHLNGDEVWVRIQEILSSIGDAHTTLRFPTDNADLPLVLQRFENEYRVVRVGAGMEKALGARVIEIEDTPIERVRELLLPLAPQDENVSRSEALATIDMTIGAVLHGVGVAPDRSRMNYTLMSDDGQQFTVEAHAVATNPQSWHWVSPEPMLYQQHGDEQFWFTMLPESHTLYCNVRSMRRYLKDSGRELLKAFHANKADRLIIDLRQNTGGDYFEGLHGLIEPIRDDREINRKGRLFVIIGPLTFSAAMANAAQFRSLTNATLVGQTIGEKPNEYSEPRDFKLPNSHLTVRYSTRYYEFAPGAENTIRPDQEVVPTWENVKAGRDQAVQWIVSQPVSAALPTARLSKPEFWASDFK